QIKYNCEQIKNNINAFVNKLICLRNLYLRDGNNRSGPAYNLFHYVNNRFWYGNDYFLRALRNSLIRWVLMVAGNNRFRFGNYCLRLGNDYSRSENDRRRCINNRVRQGNGSLRHDNDRGRSTNNRFRGGKDRVVDRVDRRGTGNTRFAIINDYR